MTGQRTISHIVRSLAGSPRSVAGSALIGPGLFLLFGNLMCAATQLSHLFGELAAEGLSLLPSMIVVLSYDQRWLVQTLVRILWPLLLVVLGTILLSNDTVGESKPCPDGWAEC